jgi:hypothetical protein
MKSDNLFDARITPLDVVKILLLLVTCFSTYNIVDLMTPDTAWAFVRELAAVGVIEGAFLGFEYATKDAKNKSQMQYATIGFFLSLSVIAAFAGVSGLAEFGGESLLTQPAGNFLGIAWSVRDWVMLFALVVTVGWIFALAAIYRLYSLADPDKQAELTRNQTYGDMKAASNQALKDAMRKATPTITIQRALAQIRKDYETELTPAQLDTLLRDVESHLRANVHETANASRLHPDFRPTRPGPGLRAEDATAANSAHVSPFVEVATMPSPLSRQNGNGHQPE